MEQIMKHKVFLLVVAVLLLAVGVGATAAQDEPLTIGLVQLGTDNPFWIAQVAGGQEAARRYGFELQVTSGEGDVTRQVEAFEDLVNQGVDAISINPLDAQAWARLAREQSPGIEIEATGGITLENARAYADAGADFISVGALTHSVKAADIAVEIKF